MKPFPEGDDKREWRTWAHHRRSAIDFEGAPAKLLPRVIQLIEWESARRVLLYNATPTEISVGGLIARPTDKQWHFPCCAPGRRLTIHRYDPASPWNWTLSRFGVEEPPPNLPEVSPDSLDLVIVPALLFDQRGFRIGYGGGYYDRFLQRLRPDCVFIGLTLDALVVPVLPSEPHDIPVQILITEGRTIRRADTTAQTPPPYSG